VSPPVAPTTGGLTPRRSPFITGYEQDEKGHAVMLIVFGILGLVLLLAGLVLALLGIHAAKQAYLLDAPLVRAAELRPGFCKVRGRVVAVAEPMRSPVTDRPCVYYRLRVQEEKRKWKTTKGPGQPAPGAVLAGFLGGALGAMLYTWARSDDDDESTKVIHSWITVLDEAESIPLVIEDNSGRVAVEMRDAEVIVKEKSRIVSDFQRPAPDRLRELLHKRYRLHTVDDSGKLMTMNFQEAMLAEGVKVTVLGQVEVGEDGAPCFRSAGGLLVSERDVGKQAKSARKWAFGFALAAGGTLLLAVGTLAAVAAVWTA
jgi:hypothetical protein